MPFIDAPSPKLLAYPGFETGPFGKLCEKPVGRGCDSDCWLLSKERLYPWFPYDCRPFGWLDETCCGEAWGAIWEYGCECCGVGGMATVRKAARGLRCSWVRQTGNVNGGPRDAMRCGVSGAGPGGGNFAEVKLGTRRERV